MRLNVFSSDRGLREILSTDVTIERFLASMYPGMRCQTTTRYEPVIIVIELMYVYSASCMSSIYGCSRSVNHIGIEILKHIHFLISYLT